MAYRSPEKMQLMLDAIKTTSGMRSRTVRCPNCGHRSFEVYEGTTGFLKSKCGSCKQEVTFNLVAMRRTRYPMRNPYGLQY